MSVEREEALNRALENTVGKLYRLTAGLAMMSQGHFDVLCIELCFSSADPEPIRRALRAIAIAEWNFTKAAVGVSPLADNPNATIDEYVRSHAKMYGELMESVKSLTKQVMAKIDKEYPPEADTETIH